MKSRLERLNESLQLYLDDDAPTDPMVVAVIQAQMEECSDDRI